MASKKKVGGLKRRVSKKKRAPAPPTRASKAEKDLAGKVQAPSKKVGGLKASPTPATHRGAKKCDECDGFMYHGNWHHDSTCPRLAVMWKAAGFTRSDWRCVYDCEPTEFPGAFAHKWNCPFWNTTDETPFDRPVGTATVAG